MSGSTVPPLATTPTESLVTMLAWPATLAETLCQTQRAQFEAIATWQQAMTGFSRQLWDDWVAHWAGGVPLDG
jgi:hypothetical protein